MSKPSTISKINGGLLQLGQMFKHMPFTVGMVLLLLLAAWLTRSYAQELARVWVIELGFAPRDFWFFRWERLILSALVTSGGGIFWLALGMVAITSGLAEWMIGSWKAALTFWGVHLVTLVIESMLFVLPLHQLGFIQARTLFFSRDVGPSAGYMGSLGLVATFLPKPWRWLAFITILIILIVSLFLQPRSGETQAVKLSADLAHLLAFPLGWMAAFIYKGRRNP